MCCSPKSYNLSLDCPPCLVLFKMARLDDKATADRVLSLPEEHPRHLAPTIALRESPELIDLVQEYRSRFQSKKSVR